jgi:signal transduction histidine kinase
VNRALWWRFLAASVLCSVLLSLLYVGLVRETNAGARSAVQRSVMLLLVHALEPGPYPVAMQRLDALFADSPELPRNVWVVDERGRVLAQRGEEAPPPQSQALLEPMPAPHELRSLRRSWLGGTQVSAVRLQADAPRFVLALNVGLPGRPILRTQALFFVGALVLAMLLGLGLVLLYLRGRSQQVRAVIARLEGGDLGARLRPDRLDDLGRLMLDFNRMADEIERLVRRLQDAETARRSLLQELGHDLRTPLTSLRTAVETLSEHGSVLSDADRAAFLGIVRGELDYFVRLIDDLFFIADLDEPRYRRATEGVDVVTLLRHETDSARQRHRAHFGFVAPAQPLVIPGDRMLLARLLRNALDNAGRHARSKVDASLRIEGGHLLLQVEDDGAGIGAGQAAAFGRRRSQRVQTGAAEPTMSLGLGSVIMKTIVELHGGTLAIAAGPSGGTRLRVTLPAPAREPAEAAG